MARKYMITRICSKPRRMRMKCKHLNILLSEIIFPITLSCKCPGLLLNYSVKYAKENMKILFARCEFVCRNDYVECTFIIRIRKDNIYC